MKLSTTKGSLILEEKQLSTLDIEKNFVITSLLHILITYIRIIKKRYMGIIQERDYLFFLTLTTRAKPRAVVANPTTIAVSISTCGTGST